VAERKSAGSARTLTRRLAYAAASSALAAVLLLTFGKGSIAAWNTLPYWSSVALVFVVALAIYGKVD
jgi:membrane protein YdbS with pleckstrin-like domain